MNINTASLGNVIDTTSEINNINVKKVSNDSVKTNTQENPKYTPKELKKSLEELDNLLQGDGAHTEYSVNKDFGTIMIKIVDDKTKEVLFETPPEKILNLIASICRNNGLFDKKV